MTDFLSNGNTSRNTNSYHQALCHLMISTYNATPDQNTYPHTSTYTTHTPHAHTHTHTFHHFSTFMKLRISPGIHLFWGGSRKRGSYLGVYNKLTLMRKLHVRLAQSLLNAWRLRFVEDQRGRVRRLGLLAREDIRIEPWYLSLLWSGLLYTLTGIRRLLVAC